ncbi:MAG: carboxypeptidase-like regulatory domain-containing protein [Bacteroidales bacterium]
MKKTLILLVFLFALTSFNHVSAHGIHVDYSFSYPSVSLNVYFSKTSPVVDADVSIFSPVSGDVFVSGKTDKDGNFAFNPDVPGEWTVKVDDGMGHRKTVLIAIEDFSDPLVSESVHNEGDEIHSHDPGHVHDHDHDHITGHDQIPLVYKIIFGLALIFGLAGVWYGLKARKK